jgi:hypothetical protein
MEKTSKIKSSSFKREWAGKDRTIYYHDLELENGDKGSAGAREKNPAKFNVGAEITYTIEVSDKGNTIKLVNQQQQQGFKKGGGGYGPDQRIQNISFAMRYTVDLAVARQIDFNEDAEKTFNKIFSLLDKKYQEIKGEKPEEKTETTPDNGLPREPVNTGQVSHVKKIVETGNLFTPQERTDAIEKVKALTRAKAGSFIEKLITEANKRKEKAEKSSQGGGKYSIDDDDLPF